MPSDKRPYGYWTIKENVLDDARRFNSQREWARASAGAHMAAKRRGWMREACEHMTGGHKHASYWTLDRLRADARQYQSPSAWKKANASAYATAIARGRLDVCCEHMARIRKPEGHWTKERVLASAERHSTIVAWSLSDGAAYDAAKRSGWYREATKHMVKTYSNGEFTICRFLLQHDISFDQQRRFDDLKDKSHLRYDFYLPGFNLVVEYQGRQHFGVSKSSMFKKDLSEMQRRDELKRQYAEKAGMAYLEIDREKPADIESALIAKLEEVSEMKGVPLVLVRRELTTEESATLSNLGIWTKEAVIADAMNYTNRVDWSNCGNAACATAYSKGWIEEATRHMVPSQKPKGYWTKERVLEDARQYRTSTEWFRASQSAYATAQARGWLPEVTAHMVSGRAPKQEAS